MRAVIISSCLINLSMLNYGITWHFIKTIPSGNLPDFEYALSILCIICGFICGAIVSKHFGRKICIILSNVPLLISWTLLYLSVNRVQKNVAYGILYIDSCLTLLPVVIFISEITKPNLRGRLLASSILFVSLGVIIEEIFKKCFTIRQIMLMNSIVPCITFVLLLFVPESPYWLIGKGKIQKARESLNWYLEDDDGRSTTEIELKCLCKEMGKLIDLWIDNSKSLNNSDNVRDKSLMGYSTRRQFINTLLTITFLSFSYHFCGLVMAKYYLEHLFIVHSLKGNTIIVIVYEMLQICGTLISVFSQRYAGRRLLNMITITLVGILNFLLAIYCFANNTNNIDSLVNEDITTPWYIITLLIMILLIICVNCGLRSLPWILCGELYENRFKCYGVALIGIFSYIFECIVKMFFEMGMFEHNMIGICLLFGLVSFLSLLFIGENLIETEGKTLYNIQNMLRTNHVNKNIDNQIYSFDVNEMNNFCHI